MSKSVHDVSIWAGVKQKKPTVASIVSLVDNMADTIHHSD